MPTSDPEPNEEPEQELPSSDEKEDATEITSSNSSVMKEILVIDDEKNICTVLSRFLTQHNLKVQTATGGKEGLEILGDATALLLVDLKMPDMNGIEVIKAARNRGWDGKVIIMTGYSSKETIVAAAQLGVSDYMTKPIDTHNLLERVEEALQITRPLHAAGVPSEFHDCILDPERCVPLFAQGEIALDFETLQNFSKGESNLIQREAIIPTCNYYAVNDVKKEEDLSSREPSLKKDHPIDEKSIRALARIWHDEYAGILTEDGKESRSILVKKNEELGEYTILSSPCKPESFASELRSIPLCAHILQWASPEEVQPALTALADAWQHHEVGFLMYQLTQREDRRLSKHLMATAFLSTLHASNELTRTAPDLDPEDRRIALAIVGVCAALHDLGMATVPSGVEFGSKAYLRAWEVHATFGHDMVKGSSLYPEVKTVIRDHHKLLTKHRSRYDALTRIVQMASDLEHRAQGVEILPGANSMVSQDSVGPLDEVCRQMVFRGRQGLYQEEELDNFLSDCKFEVLVDYYKRLQEISKWSCNSAILSPGGKAPMTTVCRQGPSHAKEFEKQAFCEGCSTGKSHSYHGDLYHRCLSGHQLVGRLNNSIKHLEVPAHDSETSDDGEAMPESKTKEEEIGNTPTETKNAEQEPGSPED